MQATEEWRALINYIDEHPNLIKNNEEIQKPRPLKQFDENEHKVLNAELKFLYTAITRARCNLWIYDSDPNKSASVFYYFQKRGLVRVLSVPNSYLPGGKGSEAMEQIFTKPSSVEEWKQQGDHFRDNKNWDMAIFCYAQAGMDELVQEMKAHSNMWRANTVHKMRNYGYLKASLHFLRVFDTQPSKKWINKAAICLFKASKYEVAASLFVKLDKVRILTVYIKPSTCVDT